MSLFGQFGPSETGCRDVGLLLNIVSAEITTDFRFVMTGWQEVEGLATKFPGRVVLMTWGEDFQRPDGADGADAAREAGLAAAFRSKAVTMAGDLKIDIDLQDKVSIDIEAASPCTSPTMQRPLALRPRLGLWKSSACLAVNVKPNKVRSR